MNQPTPITVNQQSSATTRDVFQNATTPDACSVDVGARHLYIHIPFCFHKCHYCDFYSFVDSRDRQAPFTDALITQLRAQSHAAAALDTVFVGGGTPSLLRVELWRSLLRALDQHFDCSQLTEFTVECNPETVTDELMGVLASGAGHARVSRVSVGAQSFNPAHLKTLERWHDPANVERAVELAQAAGIHRRSIDLIYAIPGQSLDDVRADLNAATALPIDHVSAYALTYEPNTAMTKRMELRHFEPAPDDLEADMFDLVHDQLAHAGLTRYETSNFTRSTASQSRHNLAYWRQRDWLAVGPSASGHFRGTRWKNVPRLTDWMDAVNNTEGHCPVHDLEPPDPTRALAERLMTGLRLTEGIPEPDVDGPAHALGVHDALADALAPHINAGLLERAEGVLRCTDAGMRHADGIAADAIAAIL